MNTHSALVTGKSPLLQPPVGRTDKLGGERVAGGPMGCKVLPALVALLILQRGARTADGFFDCTTVLTLVSSCSDYIMYGIPDPTPGSPCCNAAANLSNIADSAGNRRSACRCLMGLITTYNPKATAVGRLPGLCGISLGFTVDPNTDCSTIP